MTGVRIASVIVAAVGVTLGPAAHHAPAAAPAAASGIRGQVLLGPTCPVERPGRPCTRPYQAWLTIRREPANTVVRRVRSSATDGRFSTQLPPGRYRLQPRNGRPYPRARAQTVTVNPQRFTVITVRFDSGIR
jgi:hypothetical protein